MKEPIDNLDAAFGSENKDHPSILEHGTTSASETRLKFLIHLQLRAELWQMALEEVRCIYTLKMDKSIFERWKKSTFGRLPDWVQVHQRWIDEHIPQIHGKCANRLRTWGITGWHLRSQNWKMGTFFFMYGCVYSTHVNIPKIRAKSIRGKILEHAGKAEKVKNIVDIPFFLPITSPSSSATSANIEKYQNNEKNHEKILNMKEGKPRKSKHR